MSRQSNEKRAEYQRGRRSNSKSIGLCYDCAKPIETAGRSRCDLCYAKKQSADKFSYYARRDNGMCARCGSQLATTSGVAARCMDCFFKDTAYKVSHRTGEKVSWKLLKDIWNRQNGVCPFTGIKLTPALDAQLDHINPVSRCANPNEPENLRWVYYRVNHAKYDMTDDEFVDFILMLSDKLRK